MPALFGQKVNDLKCAHSYPSADAAVGSARSRRARIPSRTRGVIFWSTHPAPKVWRASSCRCKRC